MDSPVPAAFVAGPVLPLERPRWGGRTGLSVPRWPAAGRCCSRRRLVIGMSSPSHRSASSDGASPSPNPILDAVAAVRSTAAVATVVAALSTAVVATPLVSPVAPAAAALTHERGISFNEPSALDGLDSSSAVVDLAGCLARGQERSLTKQLDALEAATGVRVRILTQNTVTPGLAVRDFWGLGDTPSSVLLVVDLRGGNILNFSVSDPVLRKLPDSFWVETTNRYGNLFYVREHGQDGAIIAAVESIKTCLTREGVCRVTPGIGADQLAVTLGCSAVGGAVAGAASRTGGKRFNAPWVLLFAPLWGIFFVSFGVGTVAAREGLASFDVGKEVAAFATAAAATWWWVPIRFGEGGQAAPERGEDDLL